MEEEIDLRQYVEVLIRYWMWIAGLALLAAVAAFVVSLLLPETYRVQSTVTVIRSRTDVTFDPRIQTLSEEELPFQDFKGRNEALVGLVSSTAIAQLVLDEVGDKLGLELEEGEEPDVYALLDMVETESEGDLIHIQVTYRDPVTATLVANSWARHYEQYINDLYGGGGRSGVSVVSQVVTAKEEYEKAQAAVEAFLENNRIAELEREIATRRELLNAYQSARNAAQTQPVNLQTSADRQVLADYYTDLQNIERWLADARALRAQVAAGSGSTAASMGDALALMSLRNKALGGGGLSVQLALDLTVEQGNSVQVSDVDALMKVLEARRVETQKLIDALTAGLAAQEPNEVVIEANSSLFSRIDALNAEILALQAQLEAERARNRELQHARDLAWDTYQTLARKQAEEEVASGVTGTEVRVAAEAVAPREPVGPRKMVNTAIAGALGLMLGVFGAFAVEWWKSYGEEMNAQVGRAGERAALGSTGSASSPSSR